MQAHRPTQIIRWIMLTMVMFTSQVTYAAPPEATTERPRIIVTSDGEIDDQCSMIRFMLYTNECDVEGIVTSSSQYHWQGHKWAYQTYIRPRWGKYAIPTIISDQFEAIAYRWRLALLWLDNHRRRSSTRRFSKGSQRCTAWPEYSHNMRSER